MTVQPKRIGLVVPPANPTVEPEFRALLPAELAIHATRLPVLPGELEDRVAAYVGTYAAAVKSFGTLALDAMLVTATAPSYALGVGGDRALAARLTLEAGCDVDLVSLAILDALRALGIADIRLVSPYPAWLTERAIAYWEGAGVRVAGVVSVSEAFRAYELQTAEVLEALEAARALPGSAVVMTGTGMSSLAAIRAAAPAFDVPILSSNLCGAWHLLAKTGFIAAGCTPPACFAAAAPVLAGKLPTTVH